MSKMSDAQVRALYHTDPEAWAREVDPHYDKTCRRRERAEAAEREGDALVTRSELEHWKSRLIRVVAGAASTFIDERMAALAVQLKGAVRDADIAAALDHVARAFEAQIRVVAAPVEPVWDSQGRLTGARKAVDAELLSLLPAPRQKSDEDLRARLAELEAQVRELQSRPSIRDAGVWRADKIYCQGDATSWDGSLWIAQRTTGVNEKPGQPGGAWRLAVKRGKDAPRPRAS